MEAIKITQEIIDKNQKYGTALSKKEVDAIHSGLPDQFYGTEPVSGGYKTRTDLHEADGWQEVIVPEYDSATQRVGRDVIEVDGDFTYAKIDKTEQEIKGEVIGNSQGQRSTMIQSILEAKVIEEVQAMPDDKALAVAPIFNIWNDYPDEFRFEAGYKVNSFEGMELKLFKAISAHDKRANTQPILADNLWTLIEFGAGGVEIWKEPVGGDGKYPYLDPDTGLPYVVIHEGFYWTNNFETGLNVWVPGEYGWTKGNAI